MKAISGMVDSVTYRNDDNGFAVVVLDWNSEPLTVVGELGNVEEGEELELTGEFSEHPKFGLQFRAKTCIRSLPETAASIQRYLAGGVIKGIGPVTARAIVKKFGDDSLRIIEECPQKLAEVEGITKAKATAFSEEFKKVVGFTNVLAYFVKCGIPSVYGVRTWKKYGDKALEMIDKNPYILCTQSIELPFLKAEEIAAEKGLDPESDFRIYAGIRYILSENAMSGHTCLPMDKLVEVAARLLRTEPQYIKKRIYAEADDENLYIYIRRGREYVMLKEYYAAEDYIARRLSIMNTLAYDTGINYDEVIDVAEQENDIVYEQKQRMAINAALSKGFMVLTGGPGTGKTTTLNAIISLFEQQGLKVLICAPTGRAAKRISDLTGYDAKTIHRLLGVKAANDDYVRFEHDESELLDCDAVIVDEMSMVDTLLFEALLRALRVDCKLIMVGDSDQLPSVGAGNVLHDIIKSQKIPVIELTEIFRQAQSSSIVTNAHRIVKGEMPDLSRHAGGSTGGGDFYFMQRLNFDDAMDLTVDLCINRLPKAYGMSPIEDIQVLSPTRKGPLGTIELNKRLQAELNPPDRQKSEIKTLTYTFRTGDKVMQVKNDYDIEWKKDNERGSGIFNGDIGVITKLNKLLGVMEIDFEGRVCSYSTSSIDNLELAYAATVHKSQGSEFDAVILPILGGYDKLYFRNLLYTAVTRAKKLLVIVGSAKRIEFMVNNNRKMNRYTCLEAMLRYEGYTYNSEDEHDEQA